LEHRELLKKVILVSTALSTVWIGTPADAGPLIGAAAATAATLFQASAAGVGIQAFGFLGLSGWGAVAAQFAVRAVLGYALNALSSKPKPTVEPYKANVNQLGPALPQQVIYGETRVGGAIFYQALSNSDRTLHRCIAFAGHEIDSYQELYLNDQLVTVDVNGDVDDPSGAPWNTVNLQLYTGTDDQTADAGLVAAVSEWTEECRARGIAYIVATFTDNDAFQNGLPTVTAKIRGKKVEDPRIGNTAWSNNPALCIRDYLLSDYGLGESTENINDALFKIAADECEVQVAGSDTYTCNGAFTLDSSPEDIIRNLLSSMGGIFWNYAGQWAIQAAKYQTPEVELTDDDYRGQLAIATRHSRRDNFNTVVGTYRGPATYYQDDNYTKVSSPFYIAEDNGIESVSELPLQFTNTDVMAQRIALIYLRRNRQQITVQGEFGLRAMDLKIGDNVMLTNSHMGWTQKVFEVVDWRLGQDDAELKVTMILREIEESVFTGVLGEIADESGVTLEDESGVALETVVA
jgi:hypothetical protein